MLLDPTDMLSQPPFDGGRPLATPASLALAHLRVETSTCMVAAHRVPATIAA
jgi:hypothetical protein